MQEVHLEVVGGGDAPLLLKWTDLEDVIDPEGEVFDGFAASSSERSTRKTAESEIVLTSRSVDEVPGIAFGTVVDALQIQGLRILLLLLRGRNYDAVTVVDESRDEHRLLLLLLLLLRLLLMRWVFWWWSCWRDRWSN